MIAEPSIQCRCYVDRSIHKTRVESESERKKPKRDIAQRKRQCERIKRSRGQSAEHQPRKQEPVRMHKGEKAIHHGESNRRNDQNPARTEEAAQVHSKWPDEHQRDVERASDPRSIVVTDPQATF